jgi:methionyl-tRNA formyltransferase
MRVVLLAPAASSLYARTLACLLDREPGISLELIIIRRMWSWNRLRGELHRDGSRFLRKLDRKLIRGEALPEGSESLATTAARLAVPAGSLRRLGKALGCSVLTAANLHGPRVIAAVKGATPDALVFAGGGLLRQELLETAPLGAINCHSGLLPRYRGMDTEAWAILEADAAAQAETGLTVHVMTAGIDTGPIVLRRPLQLRAGESLELYLRRLEAAMPETMLDALRGLRDGNLAPEAQMLEAGRQYFVMHPRLMSAAERAAGAML